MKGRFIVHLLNQPYDSNHHRMIWDCNNNTMSIAVCRVYHTGGSCLWRIARLISLDKMKLTSGKCFGSMSPPRGPTSSVLASQCFAWPWKSHVEKRLGHLFLFYHSVLIVHECIYDIKSISLVLKWSVFPNLVDWMADGVLGSCF